LSRNNINHFIGCFLNKPLDFFKSVSYKRKEHWNITWEYKTLLVSHTLRELQDTNWNSSGVLL